MNLKLENRGLSEQRRPNNQMGTNITNLNIKQIQFNDLSDQYNLTLRNLKLAAPTKIAHLAYVKVQNKNRKMLPGIQLRQAASAKLQNDPQNRTLPNQNLCQHLRNSRNSQILNSLIQILKNDSDKTKLSKPRNRKIKTEADCSNQFIQMREISSVKNSRVPKIINNEIMMNGLHKIRRNLMSEEKTRAKINPDINTVFKSVAKKAECLDEIQMTFYKPSKPLIRDQNSLRIDKEEENQFIPY